MTPEFKGYPKTPRLHRDVVITEKIDGTNAAVCIVPDTEPWSPYDRPTTERIGEVEGPGIWMIDPADGQPVLVYAQSRKRIIEPGKDKDNFGFAGWVREHAGELVLLGKGIHYGEWYGLGIQRGYGLTERRFALFNPDTRNVPDCCRTVPVICRGQGDGLNVAVVFALASLEQYGSLVAAGHPAEGVIVYHTAARQAFKVTLENDNERKSA